MRLLDRLSRSLPGMIGLNSCMLTLAIGTGWFTATYSHPHVDFRIGSAAGWTGSTLLRDFGTIAPWNLRVMGTILLGVCTLGVFSLVELVWLGFSFGMDAYSISQSSRWVLPFFLTYAPIEVFAFTLAASASQSFSISVLRFLVLRERLRVRGPLLLVAAAIVLLSAAALVEAQAHQVIKRAMLHPIGGW